jgi:hypothetical protein
MAPKANLVVADCYHAHDVFLGDPLTTSLIDLVIAGDDLLHYADSLASIIGKTLLVDNSWHDHIGNVMVVWERHILTISESYHLHAGGELAVSLAWSMWTETLDPPKLPVLELTAEDETRLYGLDDGSSLPGITISVRAGMRCGTLKLPDVRVSAVGRGDTIGTLAKRTAGLQLSARGGAIGGDMKLPFPQLTFEATGANVGRLDKIMPGLSISATGSTPTKGDLDKRMPTLRLSMTMSTVVTGTLNEVIPTLKLSATGSMITYGTLDRNIPPPIMSAATGHQQSADADMTMPTLIMAGIVGVGANGQAGDSISRMQNTSRFTNYVLRYSR